MLSEIDTRRSREQAHELAPFLAFANARVFRRSISGVIAHVAAMGCVQGKAMRHGNCLCLRGWWETLGRRAQGVQSREWMLKLMP
jgi:hypothetical protein